MRQHCLEPSHLVIAFAMLVAHEDFEGSEFQLVDREWLHGPFHDLVTVLDDPFGYSFLSFIGYLWFFESPMVPSRGATHRLQRLQASFTSSGGVL